MSVVGTACSLPRRVLEGVKYNLAGSAYVPKPRIVSFPVTFRCNLKCIMCTLWDKKYGDDLSLEKIREVLHNPLFDKIEQFNIHGGEPTIRKDLPEIYRAIVEGPSPWKRLWMSTNGLAPRIIEQRLNGILEVVPAERHKDLWFNVSIDGKGQIHEDIRGVKNAFPKAVETVEMLNRYKEKHGFTVSISTVIQPKNVDNLKAMKDLAEDLNVEITFQPIMFDPFFGNETDEDMLTFSPEELEKVKKFVADELIEDTSATAMYWEHFLEMAEGSMRKIPCAFDRYMISIYPTGEILPCSREPWTVMGNVYEEPVDQIWFGEKAQRIREKIWKDLCPTCMFFCSVEYAIKKEMFSFGRYAAKKAARAVIPGAHRRENEPTQAAV